MNSVVVGRTALLKLAVIAAFAALFILFSLLGTKLSANASAFGPSPTFTNAPGESNCTACHGDFELNEGEGRVEITGVPAVYTPGQQFNIVVRAEQASAVIYGFQLTAIDSTGQKIGTFVIPPESESRVQILQGVVGANNLLREYVEHTSGGLSNGQFGFNTWNFSWTAPMQAAGRVDFYASGNAANSDGGPGGDYIYATSASTIPAASAITIGGRVTTPSGLPLRNTKITLTQPGGTQISAFTSSFGVYSFANVQSQVTYTLTAQSKRYRFAPKTLTPTANVSDADFVGLE